MPRESNYRALQLSIIKAQRSLLRDEAMEYAQDFVVFQLSLIDHYRSNTGATTKQEYPIHHDVQWPLYLEKIVEILDAYDGHGLGPAHIQVYATWPEKYLGQFIAKYGMSDDKPDIHTVGRPGAQRSAPTVIHVDIVGRLFFTLHPIGKFELRRCLDVHSLPSQGEWNSEESEDLDNAFRSDHSFETVLSDEIIQRQTRLSCSISTDGSRRSALSSPRIATMIVPPTTICRN